MFIVVRIRVVFLPDSGMKEDLNLYGNELNFANALWSAAYVFGQIPSNLLLTRVSHDASHINYFLTVMTPPTDLGYSILPRSTLLTTSHSSNSAGLSAHLERQELRTLISSMPSDFCESQPSIDFLPVTMSQPNVQPQSHSVGLFEAGHFPAVM